jgi:hypothetical protein
MTRNPRAAAAPLVPSDDANYVGGLLGRFAGKAATDQQDPNQSAPPDDEQAQADLQALEDRFASSGSIGDAWALYKARMASRRQRHARTCAVGQITGISSSSQEFSLARVGRPAAGFFDRASRIGRQSRAHHPSTSALVARRHSALPSELIMPVRANVPARGVDGVHARTRPP